MKAQSHSWMLRAALSGLLLAALAACGNKGDLKRPGSDAAEPQTASAHSDSSPEPRA